MNGPSERGVHAAVQDALETAPSASDGRGLGDRLSMLVDPAEVRPQLAPDVEVKEFHLRWGNDYAMIANPRDLLHYQLDPGEIELLPLMDGTRTVRELYADLSAAGSLADDASVDRLASFIHMLASHGFVELRRPTV